MTPSDEDWIDANFPCEFPLKVMGKADQAFEDFVVTTVRKHFPKIGENAFKFRKSKGDRYMAITATLWAENKQQLDALYMELSASDLVLMTL